MLHFQIKIKSRYTVKEKKILYFLKKGDGTKLPTPLL